MRALIVVCALVVTPLVAGVSQGLPGRSSCNNGKGTANRSAQGTLSAHKGLCVAQDPQDPPPTPPPTSGSCVTSQLTTGTSTIQGQVFNDQAPWLLLGGWCVELRDASSGAVLASTASSPDSLDLEGNNYVFTGVPLGSYIVCQVMQNGWHQSFPTSGPACSPNAGQPVPILAAGSVVSFIWFGNLTP